MKRNKYVNTFNTTSEFDNYIQSAEPGFPNVALTKDTGNVHYTRTSPNDYQIWGTTTATSNFNIKLNNNTNVEVTVDTLTGEFYLQGWTGKLTSLRECFNDLNHITSIKKIVLDTSSVTDISNMFYTCSSLTSINLSFLDTSSVTSMGYMLFGCSSLTTLDLSGCDLSSLTNQMMIFQGCNHLTDVYITVEATLMKLTNNLTSQGGMYYIPSSITIHYNGVLYKWQNSRWTPQS